MQNLENSSRQIQFSPLFVDVRTLKKSWRLQSIKDNGSTKYLFSQKRTISSKKKTQFRHLFT